MFQMDCIFFFNFSIFPGWFCALGPKNPAGTEASKALWGSSHHHCSILAWYPGRAEAPPAGRGAGVRGTMALSLGDTKCFTGLSYWARICLSLLPTFWCGVVAHAFAFTMWWWLVSFLFFLHWEAAVTFPALPFSVTPFQMHHRREGNWAGWRRRLGLNMLLQLFGLTGLDRRYLIRTSHHSILGSAIISPFL